MFVHAYIETLPCQALPCLEGSSIRGLIWARPWPEEHLLTASARDAGASHGRARCRDVVWRDMQLALCHWRFGAVRGGGRRWRDDVPSVLSCPIIFVYIRPTFVHEVLAIYRRALPFTSTNIIRNGSFSGLDVNLKRLRNLQTKLRFDRYHVVSHAAETPRRQGRLPSYARRFLHIQTCVHHEKHVKTV